MIRKGFYPFLPLKDLPNCKLYRVIKRDGSSVDCAYLNINHSDDRETIIVHHTLNELVRTLGNGPLGFNIIGRDDPWDFTLELSNGLIRHVEITSVSDNKEFFTTLSHEEFFQNVSLQETATPSQLRKVLKHFPHFVDYVKAEVLERIDGPETDLPNPFFDIGAHLFVNKAPIYPTQQPGRAIADAVEAKVGKKHGGKQNTILVIDNRLICAGLDELVEDLRPLIQYFQETPFHEIWLYTGYSGYYFGRDGEYALFPLKLHSELCKKYLAADLNVMPWAK